MHNLYQETKGGGFFPQKMLHYESLVLKTVKEVSHMCLYTYMHTYIYMCVRERERVCIYINE